MRIFKTDSTFNFMGRARIPLAASLLVILAGFGAYFAMGGLNYGIDFTGGTLVQARLEGAGDITAIRQAVADADIGSFALQTLGDETAHEYLITLGGSDEQTAVTGKSPAVKVEDALKTHFPKVTIRRVETVGPKVGAELKEAAAEAILFSLVAILIYVWARFQWRYSVGAIAALFHDVLIVLAAFVFTQREVSLAVVAGVLTVAGYSINDTIVIFDRIRENLNRFQKRDRGETFNTSINQTLSRTVLTSGTTLFVVLALYLFGGEIINDFAFALLVGIFVGTYSSIFIASPLVLSLQRRFPGKLR